MTRNYQACLHDVEMDEGIPLPEGTRLFQLESRYCPACKQSLEYKQKLPAWVRTFDTEAQQFWVFILYGSTNAARFERLDDTRVRVIYR